MHRLVYKLKLTPGPILKLMLTCNQTTGTMYQHNLGPISMSPQGHACMDGSFDFNLLSEGGAYMYAL